jgi:hypothetical protein
MPAITALSVITSAYRRCNRLSPGEVLSADDAGFGLAVLNELVDEMSAQALFLYRSILTSAAVTGSITLGTGSWAAIQPGAEIVSATANGVTLDAFTLQQYNALYDRTISGFPSAYAPDGLSTVFLWPLATGQTISLQSRIGVTQFADQTTTYTVPDGYTAALGASLAARIAPNIIGKIPPDLIRAQTAAMGGVANYKPAIIDVPSYTGGGAAWSILYNA